MGIEAVREKEEMQEILSAKKYELPDPEQVGKKESGADLGIDHRELKNKMKELKKSNRPHVFILAFCFTNKNQLTKYMRELGVISVASMNNERGQITSGR